MNANVRKKPTTPDPYAGLGDMLSGGLDPLVPQAGDQQNPLALDLITIKAQIREEFEDEDQTLEDLAASIKIHGVLQPIRVRPMPVGAWELVCGERRYRAAKIAGLSEIPVIWREMTDEEAEDAQLAENIHRKNLKQIETAKKIQKDLNSGLSVEAVMTKHSVNRSWMSKLLSLLSLPEQAQRLLSSGLTADVEAVYAVKTIERANPEAAKELVDRVARAGKGKINVREEADKLKRRVKPSKTHKVSKSGDSIPDTPPPVVFSPTAALDYAFTEISRNGVSVKAVIDSMDAEHLELCEAYLRGYYDFGKKAKPAEILRVVAKSMHDNSFGKDGEGLFALLAYVSGLHSVGNNFSMEDILASVA